MVRLIGSIIGVLPVFVMAGAYGSKHKTAAWVTASGVREFVSQVLMVLKAE
jgi:hypothetical protein